MINCPFSIKSTGLASAAVRRQQAPEMVRRSPAVTLVDVTGLKPIETIDIGDLVWAWDLPTGTVVRRRVKRLYRRAGKSICVVQCHRSDGESQALTVTTEHPFWVENEGWVAAGKLQPGHALKSVNGSSNTWVTDVHAPTRSVPVFNFEVEGIHNYYVGRLGVLVHNASRDDQTKPLGQRAADDRWHDHLLRLAEEGLSPHSISYFWRQAAEGELQRLGVTHSELQSMSDRRLPEVYEKSDLNPEDLRKDRRGFKYQGGFKFGARPLGLPGHILLAPHDSALSSMPYDLTYMAAAESAAARFFQAVNVSEIESRAVLYRNDMGRLMTANVSPFARHMIEMKPTQPLRVLFDTPELASSVYDRLIPRDSRAAVELTNPNPHRLALFSQAFAVGGIGLEVLGPSAVQVKFPENLSPDFSAVRTLVYKHRTAIVNMIPYYKGIPMSRINAIAEMSQHHGSIDAQGLWIDGNLEMMDSMGILESRQVIPSGPLINYLPSDGRHWSLVGQLWADQLAILTDADTVKVDVRGQIVRRDPNATLTEHR
jgi:hypothetical protein